MRVLGKNKQRLKYALYSGSEREITKNINYDLSGRRTNISPLKTIKVSCGNKALFRNSY